jgi:hypothetical protein
MNALDPIQVYEQQRRAAAYLAAITAQRAGGDGDLRVRQFERRGHGPYVHFIKEAVASGSLSDWALSPGLDALRSAFLGEADRASLLGALVGAGVVSIPMNAGVRVLIAGATAGSVSEGDQKPVCALQFSVDGVAPRKAATICVYSAEVGLAADAETQRGVVQTLVNAISAEIDRVLVADWVASSATVAATGASAATVGAILAALSNGRPRRPALVGSVADLAAMAGTLADLRSLGVVVVPSAASSGYLIGLDLAECLVADGGGQVDLGRHADILLDDGAEPTTRSEPVNLWSSNLLGYRAERIFRFIARPTAVCWAATTGSPA